MPVKIDNLMSRIRVRVRDAKKRAKKHNIPFNIDAMYVKFLYHRNNARCVLTNRPFSNHKANGDWRCKSDDFSIDQIIPGKGYIKGNIRLVTHQVNNALSDYPDDMFDSMVCARYEVLKQQAGSTNDNPY